VNNVTYTRYAESARINWASNYAVRIDPKHKKEWSDLWTPRGDGMILRSIRTEYKFVSRFLLRCDLVLLLIRIDMAAHDLA
jgi:hypothetical protein